MSLGTKSRKVEPSELAIQFECSLVCGMSGIFSRAEIADKFSANFRYPGLCRRWPQVHSFVSGLIFNSWSSIRAILRDSGLSKILSSIVEAKSVDVIHMWRVGINDKTMHQNCTMYSFFASIGANCVKTVRPFVPPCAPLPPHKTFVVRGVNDRVLALGKADESAINAIDLKWMSGFRGLIDTIRVAREIWVILSLLVVDSATLAFEVGSSRNQVGGSPASAQAELRGDSITKGHPDPPMIGGFGRVLAHPMPLLYLEMEVL